MTVVPTAAVSLMSDRCFSSVRPELQAVARYVQHYADMSGIQIVWTQGTRTEAEQAALWAKGREQQPDGSWVVKLVDG